MSYTALYRKWRPSSFEDVKGQDHIVRTLQNQIVSGRIGHAYLFCGTRGTGKTSIAKIFARAVNCEHPSESGPCNQCESCRHILEGSSLNVVEIDAASNNGVENIREIREQVQYPPTEGRYRVYIIDEVHMLSIGAFNALLKTLEEPPSYVIFILATTEVHKIPITILSRCQRYDFKRISLDTIADRLKELTQAEQIQAEDKALRYVAKAADGSMRDALSLLDQCAAFHFGENLTYGHVLEVLGAVDTQVFSQLFRAVSENRTKDCIEKIEEMVIQGRELSQFVTDFIWYLRNLLLICSSEDAESMIDLSEENFRLLREEAAMTDSDTLMRYIRIFSELSGQMRYASQKRVLLEIAFVKLTRPAMEQGLDSVLQRLSALEKKLDGWSEGTFVPARQTPRTEELEPEKEEKEPIVLPKAQYEDLMRLKGEWGKISRQAGGSARAALQGTSVEPSGEGCFTIECSDINQYSILNRDSVLSLLKEEAEKACQKSVEFKVHLAETGQVSSNSYVSDEDLKVIHMEIQPED